MMMTRKDNYNLFLLDCPTNYNVHNHNTLKPDEKEKKQTVFENTELFDRFYLPRKRLIKYSNNVIERCLL